MNANANNRIPFDRNPGLFKKGPRNNIIKKTRSNDLNLDIVFFGEIDINGKKYYRYARYMKDSNVGFLQLKIKTHLNKSLRNRLESSLNPLLTVSSSRQLNIPQKQKIPKRIQNAIRISNQQKLFATNSPALDVRKINESAINANDLRVLSEKLNKPAIKNIEIELQEMRKNNRTKK